MIQLIKAYALAWDRCEAELTICKRTAPEARAVAMYDHGWAYKRHRDFCPDCARAVAHEELDRRLAQEARGRALATELAAGWGRR